MKMNKEAIDRLRNKYPWHIECLYCTGWETLAVFDTKEEAEREFPRYRIRRRPISRYRIVKQEGE